MNRTRNAGRPTSVLDLSRCRRASGRFLTRWSEVCGMPLFAAPFAREATVCHRKRPRRRCGNPGKARPPFSGGCQSGRLVRRESRIVRFLKPEDQLVAEQLIKHLGEFRHGATIRARDAPPRCLRDSWPGEHFRSSCERLPSTLSCSRQFPGGTPPAARCERTDQCCPLRSRLLRLRSTRSRPGYRGRRRTVAGPSF